MAEWLAAFGVLTTGMLFSSSLFLTGYWVGRGNRPYLRMTASCTVLNAFLFIFWAAKLLRRIHGIE